MSRWWLLPRAAVLGLFAFGLAAHLLLLLGQPLPDLLLPLGLLAGAAAAAWAMPAAGATTTPAGRHHRWLSAGALLILLATAAALVVGVLATPERDWDGVVAWSLRARWLAHTPSLEQPSFRDPAVFSHSADYPLLQPLVLAACLRGMGEPWGRLCLPALWLLLVLLGSLAVRGAGAGAGMPWFVAVLLGTLPSLVAPGGGAVDSGYGDLLLLTVLTAAAAALVLGDDLLLLAAAALLPWAKPEGPVYGVVLLLATLHQAPLRSHAAATAGLALGLLLWLPLQRTLAAGTAGATWTAAWPAALIAALSSGARLVVDRLRARSGTLAAAVSAAALATALVLVVGLRGLVPDPEERGVMATSYLAGLGRTLERLPRLPWIALALLEHLANPKQFGFLFLALPLFWLLGRRQSPPRCPAPALGVLLTLAAPIVVLPFLLSPETDLDHHVKSSMGRLLLHWSGCGAILAGLWCSATLGGVTARVSGAPDCSRSRA